MRLGCVFFFLGTGGISDESVSVTAWVCGLHNKRGVLHFVCGEIVQN